MLTGLLLSNRDKSFRIVDCNLGLTDSPCLRPRGYPGLAVFPKCQAEQDPGTMDLQGHEV